MKRMTIAVAVTTMRVAAATPAGSDPGTWQTVASLPTARQEVGVAEVAGIIYVVGGFDGAGQSTNTVERYNPSTDTWEAVADLPAPAPLNHVGAVSVGGCLYVVGGLLQDFNGVDNVYCYDPSIASWSSKANMPTARGAMGVAVVERKIYAAGGLPSSRRSDFAVYDPATDSWTVLPSLQVPRDHLAGVGADGIFYAISGRTSFPIGLQNAVEAYDPVAGTWTSRAAIPTARGGLAAAAYDGRILAFGGEGNADSPSGVFEDVEEYDPATDTWRALAPMPAPRHGIGAAVLGDRIYIPGGSPLQGFGVTAHHDAFLPPAPVDTGGQQPIVTPGFTALYQNVPNPFNPLTTIQFDVAREGHVELNIYNVAGRIVQNLVSGVLTPQRYTVTWRGLDHAGQHVSTGVYFYHLRTRDFTSTRRMLFIE